MGGNFASAEVGGMLSELVSNRRDLRGVNMLQTLRDRYSDEYEDRSFAETPFMEATVYESLEQPLREASVGEAPGGAWESGELQTPFLSTEATEAGEAGSPSAEIASLGEIAAELKDSEFREALEQLADEALEMHAEQLAGEYGDRETRDASNERLLNEHFAPLAAQAEAMLERFFERIEGYETETLTDTELDRLASEVAPAIQLSPASEQFLGGLLKKARNLVSGAVRFAKRGVEGAVSLAGKGLAAVGKWAFSGLLQKLKELPRILLRHVVRFALGQLPPSVRPLAQKLSHRLFQAIGETHEGETEEHEQTENEAIPAAVDASRLEAEFDLQLAQLLLTPDETEADHLVSSYDETEPSFRSFSELDPARAQLASELQGLQQGETAQPAMEQFAPAAIWPIAKTAITILGRPRIVSFISDLLSKLIRPMIGDDAARLLAPAIADSGLRIFGLETGQSDMRAVTTEALAATIEETFNTISELPPHVLENETLLEAAVSEAFEEAASTYFPGTAIKPELRETADQHGLWMRMPPGGHRKRYAKYTQTPQVTITPRVAATVRTFGGATLKDHLRDVMDIPAGRTLKTNLRLYQALPGTRASDIARAEGIRPHDLHPLTLDAAGALLGGNAGLGSRVTSAAYLASPRRLHLRQRLYYIEPPGGGHHHQRLHIRLARSELMINLRTGEIRVWLYLSEPLCQQIAAEIGKTRNAATAFRMIKPLVHRAAELVRSVVLHRHLPLRLRVVGEVPNLDSRVPQWLVHVARQLAGKIDEWASQQVVQYLKNNAEEFRRASATHHDGLTLRIVMSRVPGIEMLRLVAQGRHPTMLRGSAWLKGMPAFAIVALPGYAIK
jgi:hypothetical protein